MIVEVDRERLDLPTVTVLLQMNGHRLSHATRGYIEWIQPVITQLRKTAPERLAAIRNELHLSARTSAKPTRSPSSYAPSICSWSSPPRPAPSTPRADELRALASETLRGLGS